MPLRALRPSNRPYVSSRRATKWRKTSCPCGHCDYATSILTYVDSTGGERHHALAGIATLLLNSEIMFHFVRGERHHALAGIATHLCDFSRFTDGQLVEKDIMPLRALRHQRRANSRQTSAPRENKNAREGIATYLGRQMTIRLDAARENKNAREGIATDCTK